jgi:hypothetical protein
VVAMAGVDRGLGSTGGSVRDANDNKGSSDTYRIERG